MIPAIQEVNFPSYATLHQATVSLQDMGDRVISTQVRIDGDVVPDFSGWELKFKGERFVLPSDNPQASKDNTTRNSIVDLQFQSWVIQELKRYYFFEAASVSAGVAIADKYVAPVRLNVEDFVAMLNQVLKYYFGDKVVADLYMSGQGQYSTEPKVIDINYSYLWDVIGQIYEIYGVRYRIVYNSTTGVYTIKFGYPAPAISDHDFEYGYQGGLIKFERQVQDESITNILLGRGGEKNLPYRYFKKVDPQNPTWAADPDAIPELKNIYFDRLRDINFRWYVRGWMHNPNRDTSGDEAWDPGHVFPTYEISSDSPYYWAYQKGLTDTQFNPVEFVKDDASIEAYGERWGAADDNDEIYPTIQGRSRNPIGRIDEVVAVSDIVTDDIAAMAAAAAVEKSIDRMVVTSPSSNPYTIDSDWFEIPTGQTGNIRYAWVGPTEGSSVTHIATDQSSIVAIDANGTEHPISGLSAGRYKLHLSLKLHVPDGYTTAGQWGLENIVLTTSAQDANAWKPTFDIWVKNIWGTTKGSGESAEDYAARVWEDILGDRAGNEAKVVFSTGFMSVSEDYEFVIASYPVYDTSKTINGVPSEWRITLRKSDAEYEATGLYIPNATTGGKPVAGDKFFFTGIDMPFLYVTLGEEDLNTNKSSQLEGLSVVNPTWVISLDKVRAHTLEYGEYGQTLADRLAAGAKLRITDPRFSGGDILTLYAQSITYTWNEPSENSPYIVPDIEVVLSDKVVSRQSRADKMESSIQEIRSNYARLDDVERVVRSVAEPMFLKKTGEADSSDSPTQFSSKVSSKGFRQGGVGGNGWGFYRDNTKEVAEGEEGEGDSVLEIDRIVVRKELEVNSLVVNQAEYRGGREIQSAAQIECTKVVLDDSGKYVCYFDQKQGSVKNLFVVGDFAYSTEFAPDNTVVKYYRRRVDAVDVDRIVLSDTVKDGAGVPAAGDVIIQYGHESNTARQYVIVRDVIGGGYERMISGLSTVSTNGEEYYFAGRQTGQYYDKPRWFVGDSDGEYAEYLNGILNIKGRVQVLGESGDYSDLGYLADALPKKGSTLIQGGLILTSMIQLGQVENSTFKVYSGINGKIDTSLEDPLETIAAWYGGPMVDHEASPSEANYARSLFRMNGSGYLAGGNIHWDEDGYGGIPGITWSRPSGSQNDVITIGADVMLESTGGADSRVTDLITLVRSLSNMFEDESYNEGGQTKHRIKVKSGFEGLYTNGYLSAGGISTGGGSSAVDLEAVWKTLTNESSDHTYDATTIHPAHIPVATSSAVGGIKLGYEENGRNYAVKLSDGKAYVTIPWVDPESTTPLADAIGDVSTAVKGIGETIVDLSMNVDGLHAGLMELADEDLALLGRIETLADYFDASGNAKSALKLTTAGPLNIWGVQYWNNGIPNAVTGRPELYIARTRVNNTLANDTLLGVDAISNASSSGSSDQSRIVWEPNAGGTGIGAWHFLGNVYADGWVSAGGLSSGGGQAAGNASLSNVTTLAHGQTGELSASGVGSLVLYDKDAIDYMIENAGQVKKVAGISPDSLGDIPAASLASALGLADSAYRAVASTIGSGVAALVPGSLIQSVLGDGTWDSTHTVKAFVNSSIATATATYRGSYNLVSDLSLTTSATQAQIATALASAISTADNNDYCYVQIPTSDSTPTEIAHVDRYKHNGTAWSYEYTLNNSGYTAAQWAAINSGITTAKRQGYDTIVGYFSSEILSYNHGGTGLSSYAKGDLIYASAANTLAKLAANSTATKKFLSMTSSVPSWDTVAFGDLPDMYIGNAKVKSSAQTAQDIGGLGSITASGLIKTTNYVQATRFYLSDSVYFVLDANGVKLEGAGFYTDSFVSAGGLSTGGGATGATLEAVWKTLINDSSDHTYDSTLIDGAHIPDMASTYGYIKSVSLAEGATNGTIHIVVDGAAGSDVAVHGLGTAAYANTTAFAAATHSHTISDITDFPSTWAWANITGAPSTMPSPYALTFGNKTYNGSEAKTISASDLGALTSVAFSDLTAHPTTIAGYGITDAQPLDADLTAIAGLTGTSGLLKKTAANTWTLDTNTYLTASTVPAATSSAYGGIKIGYTESNENYAVQLSSGKAYVHVADSIPYSDAIGDVKTAIKGLGETIADLSMDIDSINTLLSNPTIEAIEFKLYGGAPVMVWDETNQAWHLNGNFYADGFVSAGGVSDGGGSSGTDIQAVWTSLEGNSGYGANRVINAAHIPDMASTYGYIKNVSLSSGTSNGTIRISVDGVSASDVAVTGLGNAAYRGIASTIGSSVNDLVSGSLLYGVLGDAFDATNTVKAFVNSSIATATATFRGTNTTATTEAAFLTWANALTHNLNDYVFWKTTDSAGNVVFKRYKYGYDGTEAGSLAWRYEYDLNNSSFTAAQWSAINSGITATKVGNYDTIAGYFTNGLLQASHVGDLSGTYVVKGGLSVADGTIATWGTLTAANGYSAGMHWGTSDGGDATISYKGGQISMQVDGYFYQNEGAYRVADTSDLANYLPLSGGTMSNTNLVTNLNADLLDGKNGSDFGYTIGSDNWDCNEVGTHFASYRFGGSPLNGFPGAEWSNMLVIGSGSDTMTQIGGPYSAQELYFRSGTWYSDSGSIRSASWNRIWHEGNSNKSDVPWTCSYLTVNANAQTSYRAYVNGVIASTGDQIITSDETKKMNLEDINLSVGQIASVRAVTFDFKADGRHSFGTIAQDWKGILPEAVLGEEGDYSFAYAQAAMVSSIINARAIVDLELHETEQDKEIKRLRERVNDLEAEIKRLRAN